jgi:exodeoxyribonuclease X
MENVAPARTAWVIDTETTGQVEPQVIQFAYAEVIAKPGPEFEVTQTTLTQYKPTKAIELGALATHHILPEQLEGFPPPPERFDLPKFIIGHAVDYDWACLGSPAGVYRIDTCALAKEAWPGLDSYKLGAIIYHLLPGAEARELLRDAHAAFADVNFAYRVFLAAIAAIKVDPPIGSWGDVWRLSEHARVPKVMPFGKHKGKPIADVPLDYVDWYQRQAETDPYIIQAFRNADLLPRESAA